MVDFRFHAVSLAAVFVALAIGVVLGSGPMRTALVGEISDEVERLEDELAQAQTEVETARDQSLIGEEFVDQASTLLIGDALTETNVALVLVAEPDQEDVDAQRDLVVQAGGTVVATADLAQSWTDPGQAAFRSALSAQIVANVVGVDDTFSPHQVLAHALAQAVMPELALADVDEGEPDTDIGFPDVETATDRAAVLTDLLTEADLLDATITGPADAVVIVVGDGAPAQGGADTQQGQDSVDDSDIARRAEVYAQLAGTFAGYGAAVVIASGPSHETDVPSAVRNLPGVATEVSTVTDATSYYGRYATVLALAEQREDGQGHYGPGAGVRFVP